MIGYIPGPRWLEPLLNRALELDPETRAALTELSGTVVDLEIVGAGTIRLRIDGERICVVPGVATGDANVTIRGAPLSLLRFAVGRERTVLILRNEVSLRGDIALAMRLQRLVARMDLDIEEILAQRIGDVPAHGFMRGLHMFGGWIRDAGEALLADASEYVHYEAALVVRREEVEQFIRDVDDLRDDVERLEARMMRLQRGWGELG